MSKSITLTLGYVNTDFTRKLKLEGITDTNAVANTVRSKIQALNASIAGGTDDGLTTFLRSDDYDASDSENVIGTFKGITAAQIDETVSNVIDLDAE